MKELSTLYQHGTLAMLAEGLLKGTMPIHELLKHGDMGIGTGEGLDGELIVLDGHPYLAQGNGEIIEVGEDLMVPFATVNFNQPEYSLKFDMANLAMKDLHQAIKDVYPYENIFYSITIRGLFEKVSTRAVKKQQPPYPKLVEVAEDQATFDAQQVVGTVFGYFSPHLFNGIAVGGDHVHFISDDKSIGGHLLDFKLTAGEIMIQPFADFEQHLPIDDEAFMKSNINLQTLAAEIKKAEQ